jgi:acyl-CoA thioesterase FadM
VLPHDIDVNLHLNNGRYLQLFDLNRADWLVRTGILSVVLRQGWKPVLGSVTIQYHRELRLWDRAVMETRLLGWNERWAFLEHRMVSSTGQPVALALAKAGFRSRGKWVEPARLRGLLPFALPELDLPDRVRAWQQLDQLVGQRLVQQRAPVEVADV